jgi:AraC family transcriptional regulator
VHVAGSPAQIARKAELVQWGPREIGRTEQVRVSVVRDQAGRADYPGSSRVVVAMHVGRPVEMCCRRAGQVHRGRAIYGDIDIIPAHTPGIWELRGADAALAVGVDSRLLKQVAAEYGQNPERLEIRNRFQARDAQMEHLAWAIKAEMEGGYPSGRIYMDGLAAALAARLVREHSWYSFDGIERRAPKGRLAPRKLKSVLEYIEDHLRENLGLDEIAAVAALSVSHFKAMFRESMGMPAHRYLIRRRVERAAEMLRESDLAISQVALETGFAHQSHLASHLRKVMGRSPREVRRDG